MILDWLQLKSSWHRQVLFEISWFQLMTVHGSLDLDSGKKLEAPCGREGYVAKHHAVLQYLASRVGTAKELPVGSQTSQLPRHLHAVFCLHGVSPMEWDHRDMNHSCFSPSFSACDYKAQRKFKLEQFYTNTFTTAKRTAAHKLESLPQPGRYECIKSLK